MGLGLCRESTNTKTEIEWKEKLKNLDTKQRQLLNNLEELKSASISLRRKSRVKENIIILKEDINTILLEARQLAHELGPLWESATLTQERNLKNQVQGLIKGSKNRSDQITSEIYSIMWKDAA